MNCIVIDDDKEIHFQLTNYINLSDEINLIHSFTNPLEAISFLNTTDIYIDFMLIDVEMPDMSGIDLVRSLHAPPQIIFISNKPQYAVDGFDNNITDYLLKPITLARFNNAIYKVKARQTPTEKCKTFLFIRTQPNIYQKVNFSDIVLIESLNNYVIIQTFDNKYSSLSRISGLEKQLPEKDFIRVHRSFIVNIHKIENINENNIIVNIGNEQKIISISRSYRDNFFQSFNFI